MDLVRRERAQHPHMGGRKLLQLIRPELERLGIIIGRDRFFGVLREHGLLIRKRRAKGPQTTNSQHAFRRHENLLVRTPVTGPHQALVSDITYLRVGDHFGYLSLVTDAWSRKIVGWCLHRSLATAGPLAALDMAIAQLPSSATPIHHSDRGFHYCCHAYIDRLTERGLTVSMTEINHCYENAMAERINGILKHEYELRQRFGNFATAMRATKQAIWLYNTRRPHLALNYGFPEVVHAAA